MLENVGTQCYNDTVKVGAELMSNADAVREYHKQIKDIKVRVPAPEVVGVDYLKLMKERAEELGFLNTKGKDKDKGNINQYILSLVEKDLGIDISRSVKTIDNPEEN